MKQLEERKQKAESEKLQQKLKKKREAKKSLQGLQNEAQRKTREFEKKVRGMTHTILSILLSLFPLFPPASSPGPLS